MDEQIVIQGGVGTMAAIKDRARLTIYIDKEHEQRFRREAKNEFRSLSDHMNAILAERYEPNEKAARANGDPKGKDGQ